MIDQINIKQLFPPEEEVTKVINIHSQELENMYELLAETLVDEEFKINHQDNFVTT